MIKYSRKFYNIYNKIIKIKICRGQLKPSLLIEFNIIIINTIYKREGWRGKIE